MAENLFCDEKTCGKPALVFGFVGGLKRKACGEHLQPFTSKQITLYNIAAFIFMQSPEDALLYEQRREHTQKGLSILTNLEIACETSWEEEQKSLHERCGALHEVVQQSYQEMWLRGQQCYEQMKQDIADTRSQFEQLLLDPDYQLSPEVSELCEEIPPNRLFCVIAGDSRKPVAESLMTNFQILSWNIKKARKSIWGRELRQLAENHAAANRLDIAVRVAEYSKQFEAEGPDFTNEAIQQSEETSQQLQCMLSFTTTQEAEDCLKIGQTARKTGEFDAALTELQRGIKILRGSNSWELYLQLNCTIGEIHFQRGNYEDTVEICKHILSIWIPAAHSLEYLQALYYLICSHIELNQLSQAYAAEEEWAKELVVDCSSCELVSLCTKGLLSAARGEKEEGEQCIERALKLALCPSLIVISSRDFLSQIYQLQGRLDLSEQTLRSVCELCSSHFPHSIDYSKGLRSLGEVYTGDGRHMEAEEQFLKAIQLCSIDFPHSIEYVRCLLSMGLLYGSCGKRQDEEQLYIQAIDLCSPRFSDSLPYAFCLMNLGVVYIHMNRHTEAEEPLIQALQQFSSHSLLSIGIAQCLINLGAVYKFTERYVEAEEQYAKSIQFCCSHFPQSIEYPHCVANLGLLYRETGRLQEAEEQYMKAIPLYSTGFPQSVEFAGALFDLGVLYRDSRRNGEAVARLTEARRLFERVGTQSDLENCDFLLQLLDNDVY